MYRLKTERRGLHILFFFVAIYAPRLQTGCQKRVKPLI